MQKGQIVFSISGRDKGLIFIVIDAQDEYVFLTDGKLRPLSKPKKKKLKHIQPTNTVINLDEFTGRGLQDADIRKLLALYLRR